MNFGTLAQDDVIVNKDYSNNNESQVFIPKGMWNAEYKEPTNTIDYRRAFKIACDLLNGTILYGVDTDKIFEIMMDKDGIVTNDSYEEYILTHMQELDQGQYASSSGKPNMSVIPTGSAAKYEAYELDTGLGSALKKISKGRNGETLWARYKSHKNNYVYPTFEEWKNMR